MKASGGDLASFGGESQDKGKLLLEESEEDLQERARKFIRFERFAIAIVLSTCVGSIVVFALVAGLSVLFWWFALIIVGAIVVSVPVLLFEMRRQPRPYRIYEKGIDIEMGRRMMVFYSYGEIDKVTEQKISIPKETYYVFQPSGSILRFSLRKGSAQLEAVIESIRPKLGKPEFLVTIEPTEEDKAAARRHEYGIYLIGVFIGIPLTVVFLIGLYYEVFTFSYLLFEMILALPLLMMALTVYAIVVMKKQKKFAPPELNLKIPALLIVGILVYFFIATALSDVIIQGVIYPSENAGPRPISNVLNAGTYDDASIDLTGNIVVDTGQTLHLRNSTLLMNLSSDKEFGIWVAEGGNLILENSTIRSSSQFVGYTFEIMGSATITGSDISGIWGNEEQVNLDGGIEIYSSEVIIESSYIHHARTNGILVVNSNPLISNTTVEFADDDCIELQNSDATILNNTINSCSWGLIVMRGSNPTIKGNIISRNLHGAYVGVVSNPIIVDNSFEHNRYYGLEIDDDCDPSMSGNTYSWNGEDVIMGRQWNRPDICISTTVIVATVCLSVLFIVQRKRLTEDRSPGTI